MRTWSGKHAPLSDGEGEVAVLDIIMGLGRTRRFGGAGSLEWTVLHHSMLVALLWLRAGYPREQLHLALLHDAHEAYLGDIPAPVKAALREGHHGPEFPPLKRLENHVDGRIASALGYGRDVITPELGDRIKACDLAALLIESRLFGAPRCHCEGDVPAHRFDHVVSILRAAGFLFEVGELCRAHQRTANDE